MSREEPVGAPSGASFGRAPLVSGDGGWERRGVIGAGMLCACVLGVVAGVWARPQENGELVRITAARQAYGPLPSQLQVVIEPDLRPPLEAPLPIAAGAEPVSVIAVAPPPVAAPVVPVVASPPVVRIVDPEPAPPKPRTIEKLETRPEAVRIKADRQVRVAKAETTKPAKAAEADIIERAKAEKSRLAKLERKKAAAAEKAELARKEEVEKKAAARLAWLAKVERRKAEEREAAEKLKLARAEKPAPKAAAVKAAPAKPAPAKPVVQLASVKPAARPAAVNSPPGTLDLQLAALRAEPLKVQASAPVSTPKPVAPAPRPAPAAARSCQSESRAEELVCADPRLAAADRRLTSAYRRALQAGASPDRLRRQQGAWLAARAQAAEEAPWALARVYDVRIAELNDEAEQAEQGN